MGGTLVPGGAMFRVWAPRATAVHVSGDFNGWTQDAGSALAAIGGGHWAAFIPNLKDGDQYLFHVTGPGSSGYKRDPRARLLTFDPAFPNANCVLRDPGDFPWRCQRFVPPAFNDLVIYELHVGSYDLAPGNQDGSFFDVILRIPYLAALGVNAIELMPIAEFPTSFSLGYNDTDLFSPENRFGADDEAELETYLAQTNVILKNAGQTPYETSAILRGADNQLRALIDICHVHGVAVIFDVVYNHGGGDFDDHSMWFLDRMPEGDNNDSLYFTSQGWAGGLVFAYWNDGVRQTLIDNAKFFLEEYRIDGLRFDEVSVMDRYGGWSTCQDLTATLRAEKPEAIQIAEYWPVNPWVVKSPAEGGAGFDATWNDTIRDSVRGAITSAAAGAAASVSMQGIANAIAGAALQNRWRAVQSVENHDIVYAGRAPRIPALADSSNPRSWYARSRSRLAMALVLTAPGIPMLFMGQEILEDKQWSDTPSPATAIWWAGLATDKAMSDFLRFTQDLIGIRRNLPALRAEGCAIIHVSDDNRVLAFQRWIDGFGEDVIVVCSFRETTWYGYSLGFPAPGRWREVFNSDAYDNFPNPQTAGNGGAITAGGPAMHGLPTSAALTIPANGLLIFARG